MDNLTTEEKLQERIKELSCLYRVSSVLLSSKDIEMMMSEICQILKDAWRHSYAAIVEFELDDHKKATNRIKGETVSQTVDVFVYSEIKGKISVHYDANQFNQSDFLEDEYRLLSIIAAEIGSFCEKHLNNIKIEILNRSAARTDRLSILGEITAGIAHELNTPLGNILGYAELIVERASDQQSRFDGQKVIKSAIYAREIVKKLMFFSCEMPHHKEFIKIEPIVTQALRMLEPIARKAEVTFQLKIQDAELVAQIDHIQLTQVLFNIITNSIYFSPNSVISVDLTNDTDFFYIDISDLGSGISDIDKTKILDPFFTTKSFGEGTGLGLSVVHGIIKSHKGEISVTDNQPSGTRFLIKLPLKH